jgi:hypothetical protein
VPSKHFHLRDLVLKWTGFPKPRTRTAGFENGSLAKGEISTSHRLISLSIDCLLGSASSSGCLDNAPQRSLLFRAHRRVLLGPRVPRRAMQRHAKRPVDAVAGRAAFSLLELETGTEAVLMACRDTLAASAISRGDRARDHSRSSSNEPS